MRIARVAARPIQIYEVTQSRPNSARLKERHTAGPSFEVVPAT